MGARSSEVKGTKVLLTITRRGHTKAEVVSHECEIYLGHSKGVQTADSNAAQSGRTQLRTKKDGVALMKAVTAARTERSNASEGKGVEEYAFSDRG